MPKLWSTTSFRNYRTGVRRKTIIHNREKPKYFSVGLFIQDIIANIIIHFMLSFVKIKARSCNWTMSIVPEYSYFMVLMFLQTCHAGWWRGKGWRYVSVGCTWRLYLGKIYLSLTSRHQLEKLLKGCLVTQCWFKMPWEKRWYVSSLFMRIHTTSYFSALRSAISVVFLCNRVCDAIYLMFQVTIGTTV